MAKKQTYVVATFHTTAQALGMKAVAVDGGLKGRLAPIPRQLSAGCGFAWLEPAENEHALRRVLEGYTMGYEDVALCEL